MTGVGQSGVTDRIALTMAPEAAEKFMAALSYAAAVIQNERVDKLDPSPSRKKAEEAIDWLLWGHNRTLQAKREHDG